MILEKVAHQISVFGEGPLWDVDEEMVLWVDLYSVKLLTYSYKTGEEKAYQLPSPATSIIKYSKNKYLLVMSRQINIFDLEDETLKELVSFKFMNQELLLNDAKLDDKGRIWVGSVDINFKEFKENKETFQQEFTDRKAALYRIDTDLTIHQVKEDIALSNGLDWDQERNSMYHVDSATQSIFKYDYDSPSGELTNLEVVYKFNVLDGFPDGMTIDSEGMLWVALFKPGTVAQVSPSNGVIAKIDPFKKEWIDSIIVPTTHVTSCAFGGNKLKTLFITTAAEPLSESERLQQPQAGKLFSVELEVEGYPQRNFKGNLISSDMI